MLSQEGQGLRWLMWEMALGNIWSPLRQDGNLGIFFLSLRLSPHYANKVARDFVSVQATWFLYTVWGALERGNLSS